MCARVRVHACELLFKKKCACKSIYVLDECVFVRTHAHVCACAYVRARPAYKEKNSCQTCVSVCVCACVRVCMCVCVYKMCMYLFGSTLICLDLIIVQVGIEGPGPSGVLRIWLRRYIVACMFV